jgi:ParB-like chromosome segregation protein Spo0J
MTAPPLEVRTLSLSAVAPAAYNPRKPLSPKDPAYRKLKASVERFGLVEPLVWNQRSGRLVGGHARLSILRELGHETVPVAVVDLDDDREKALNVVLNNPAAQGRYDSRKLATLLTELDGLPAFADTGFDPSALRALTLEPAPDAEPPPPANRVEVTLVTDAATFAAAEAELDALVTRHGLEAHVRRTTG